MQSEEAIEKAEKAIKKILKHADEAEIFYSSSSERRIKIRSGKIELYNESLDSGFGIRVIKKKKLGFYFSNSLDEKSMSKVIKIAENGEKDENFSLPEKQNYRFKSIKQKFLSEAELGELCKAMVNACYEKKAMPASGDISTSREYFFIINSNGIFAEDRACFNSCYLSAIVKGAKETSTGFYLSVARELPDAESVGSTAGELANASLKTEKINARKIRRVILKPLAVTELFEHALIPSFSADNVQRKRSLLADKLNEIFFSKSLSIFDDATNSKALMSFNFDGEGVKAKKKVIIEKGVVKNFLYDTYTARKENKESSGNGIRHGYNSMPKIWASNFIIECDEKIDSYENALIVNSLIGAHTANFVSGDFSCEVRNAFFNGKAIKKAMLYGNIFSCLQELKAGDDYEQFSSVLSPSLEFEKIIVSV